MQNTSPRFFFFKFVPAGKSLRTVEYCVSGGVTVLLLLLLLLHPLFVKNLLCEYIFCQRYFCRLQSQSVSSSSNIKIKIFSVYAMKTYWGNGGMAPHIRTSALDAAWWSTSSSGHFRRGKSSSRYPFCMRLGGLRDGLKVLEKTLHIAPTINESRSSP